MGFRQTHRYRPWNERDRRRRFRPLAPPLLRVPAFLFEVLAQGGLEFLETELEAIDLRTAELRALLVLAHTPRGAMSQAALTDRIHASSSSMSRLLDDLEELGVARRGPGRLDGRTKTVSLTTSGRDLAANGAEAAERAGRLFLEPLERAERRQLVRALEKLLPEEVPWWALD